VSTGQPNSKVVLVAATKKSINDINNSNPVKHGALQGTFFDLCFFSKPPLISDAPEKPICKVYSGTLIVSSFIILLYHVRSEGRKHLKHEKLRILLSFPAPIRSRRFSLFVENAVSALKNISGNKEKVSISSKLDVFCHC
jgi:hypothetical protein